MQVGSKMLLMLLMHAGQKTTFAISVSFDRSL